MVHRRWPLCFPGTRQKAVQIGAVRQPTLRGGLAPITFGSGSQQTSGIDSATTNSNLAFVEELVLNWNNRSRIVGRPGANGEVVRKPWIEWLIEDHNLEGMDEDSKTLFAREMVKAEIELLKIRLEKLKGNYDARQLDEALTALGLQSPTLSGASIGSLPHHLVAQPEITSISLSELIEDYWEDRVGTWKPRTIVEFIPA